MTKKTITKDQDVTFRPDFIQIPGAVAFDKNIQPLDKNLYGIIYWFQRLKDGKCFASNRVLANLINSSPSGVANALVRLSKAGFITVIMDDKQHRKEIRALVFMVDKPYSNEEGGVTHMSNIIKNTKKNYSVELERQMLDLHTGYVKRFKLDHDALQYLGSDKQSEALDKALARYRLTPDRKAKLATRLEDAGYDMIKKAILNADKSSWNHGDNPSGWKMDLYAYLLRSYEQVEDWSSRNA